MQSSPFIEIPISNIRDMFMVFLIIGVFCHTETQLSRNWVSTIAPLCRCFFDKLRQSGTHNFWKHYAWCRHKKYIALGHIIYDMKDTLHSVVQCWLWNDILHLVVQYRFWKDCTALGRTVRYIALGRTI